MSPAAESSAFYEFREYTIKSGRMRDWLQFFQSKILPLQIDHGMEVPGVFSGTVETDKFFWIRRFENQAAYDALIAKVYSSPVWKTTIEPHGPDYIEPNGVRIFFAAAAPASAMQ